MRPTPQSVHFLFRVTAIMAALFVVTILGMVASLFGDPRAPVARFFKEYGGWLILGEVVATLLLGILAMLADRRHTLANLARKSSSRQGDGGKPAEEEQR